MIGGHLWVDVRRIDFRCQGPLLVLHIENHPNQTASMVWAAEAEESANFVSAYVSRSFAPLQLFCRTGVFISLPFFAKAVLSFSYITRATRLITPSVGGTTSGKEWIAWVVPVGVIVGVVVLCILLTRLRRLRGWLEAAYEQYFRLFPAVYFALPWTTQYPDGTRWAGIGVYVGFFYWLLAT
jgi:hypothetical protein